MSGAVFHTPPLNWFREGIVLPTLSSPVVNSNGSVTIQFSVVPGSTNITQAATNLSPPAFWLNVATNIATTNGSWQFTDTSAANQPARFYRSVSP